MADPLAEAKALLSRGDEAGAAKVFEVALTAGALAPNAILAVHGWLGGYHFKNGAFAEAAEAFQNALLVDDTSSTLWNDLGEALLASGAPAAALSAYLNALHRGSQNARHYLAAGHTLATLGRLEEALDVWSLGDSLDPMLRKAQDHPRADTITKARSSEADAALRNHFTALHRTSVAEADAPRVSDAIWCQTHDAPFQYSTQSQSPHVFYVPKLPPVPVFDRNTLPWAPALERYADAIEAEYRTAIEREIEGHPYVHGDFAKNKADWDAIRGSGNWTAFHLYKDGKPNEKIVEHFPNTVAALAHVPMVRVNDTPLEVFFSVLAPKTKIPPHFGLSNARATVHLPLIVPSPAHLTVAGQDYPWPRGEVLAFDDSFEHSAQNDAETPRVVLIFEAWHPDLSDNERAAITRSYEARQSWLDARQLPRVDDT